LFGLSYKLPKKRSEIKMISRARGFLLQGCFWAGVVSFSATHAASLGGSAEENQKAIDSCKSPAQQVTYVLAASHPKAVNAPVTADEEKRVKDVMAAAGMVFDRVKLRATFELALDLVRANGIIRFQIMPNDGSAGFDSTKNCLAGLANGIGMAAEFVSAENVSEPDEHRSGG
jgi:hypothetical protein